MKTYLVIAVCFILSISEPPIILQYFPKISRQGSSLKVEPFLKRATSLVDFQMKKGFSDWVCDRDSVLWEKF